LKPFNFPRPSLLQALPRVAYRGAARSVDVGAIAETIERALHSAGLAMLASNVHLAPGSAPREFSSVHRTAAATVVDAMQFCRGERASPLVGDTTTDNPPVHVGLDTAAPSEFIAGSFSNNAGKRSYKLYVPVGYSPDGSRDVPMLVMLHGCTQSPDDFAAGTRMNSIADQRGFLVLYPEQSQAANAQKCWNWFLPGDQQRDAGEPCIIADMVRSVAANYRVDHRRIFVTGMSAGAAMAVVLGNTYPELFAAVGAHSGLPYRAAHDVISALSAMKRGEASATTRGAGAKDCFVPTIVFHGDRDCTVHPTNGSEIMRQATAAYATELSIVRTEHSDRTSNGRGYARTIYRDAVGAPVAEEWIIEDAGHTWSGGSLSGSFTDANGPDASAEMIRFFTSLPPGACRT
jgi:poly(hydroxyalkanoate) depolymerase family esterase